MCLILFAWQAHAEYPLVVAANRDEYHARPSKPARFWADRPRILAGRDLEAMGTWLGIDRGGRFCAVTNYRDMAEQRGDAPSRGALVTGFLEKEETACKYATTVHREAHVYRGFNLLAADRKELWSTSNRGNGARCLLPGLYGLANHLLETPWPKVVRGKGRLKAALDSSVSIEALLSLLADTTIAPDDQLPDTGLELERERMVSAARIVSPLYGTRCSTAIIVGRSGEVQFAERTYTADGSEGETVRFEFAVD